MGNPIFRFTLRHQETGSLEITEPAGWMDAKLKLERHEDFHSLVEYFEGAFIFYGTNGVDNGGIDYIRFIEQNYGPDATIGIDIEVSFDSAVTYEFIFIGQLDLTTINELKDNRAQIAIIRDDFWAKFISRKGQPVNLQSTTDLDGQPITPIDKIRLYLPSQKVRYNGQYHWIDTVTYAGALGYFGLHLDWEENILDDLKKFTLPRVAIDIGNIAGQALNLVGNIEAPWDGDYTLDIRLEAAEYGGGNWFATNMNMWVQDPTQQTETDPFTQTNVTFGADVISVYTYNKTVRLRKGQQLSIFAHRAAASDNITIFGNERLSWKTDVLIATTGNVTLSGEQTIDGVLTSADRILVKNQGSPEENGIYVTGAGAWLRATDSDSASDLIYAAVFVTGGTLNINTAWKQDETIISLGTTPITWVYATPSDERNTPYPGTSVDNHLIIRADTVYRDTTAEAYLVHDAGASILNAYGLGEVNPFYSEYFGSLFTNARAYNQNGCAWHNVVQRGLQLRGYSLEAKPFSMSFEQWWNGLNPIFNLGLSYDESVTTPDQSTIRVEEKQRFFERQVSTNFDYVFEISREYDDEKIFNKIENGYANWQSEDINGIDDPQTKHTYVTRFKKIGKGVQLHSEFIAASLAIESTRRQSIEKSKDYKFDNNTFIVSINPDDVSPDAYLPELDENFSSITNLLNSDTRYNSRLTPARNFLRWINVFNGALQSYQSSSYKFVNGEGNYDMTSNLITSCDVSGELNEKQNINVTSDYLHLPLLYTIEINLAWDDYVAIRTARHKAIGISQTASDHAIFFIKSLEYELVKGKATIKAWPIEYFNISQTEFTPQMVQCFAEGDCGTGPLDRITSEGEGRVTSEGECRIIA
jgi:hypothetical protein